MGLINVSLNGQPYDISCDDGQEEHVALLAGVLDDRVTALAETVGQVGESRLLLLAGLLVADELVEARTELERLTEGGDAPPMVPHFDDISASLTESEVAEMINGLAQRIEDIAARMKTT